MDKTYVALGEDVFEKTKIKVRGLGSVWSLQVNGGSSPKVFDYCNYCILWWWLKLLQKEGDA